MISKVLSEVSRATYEQSKNFNKQKMMKKNKQIIELNNAIGWKKNQ